MARFKTLEVAQDWYIRKGGEIIQSSHFNQIIDISAFKTNPNEFHYYLGKSESLFRYPDKELLSTDHLKLSREMEVLELISKGYNSKQIAEQLFLSIKTVTTHRRNSLKKNRIIQYERFSC